MTGSFADDLPDGIFTLKVLTTYDTNDNFDTFMYFVAPILLSYYQNLFCVFINKTIDKKLLAE